MCVHSLTKMITWKDASFFLPWTRCERAGSLTEPSPLIWSWCCKLPKLFLASSFVCSVDVSGSYLVLTRFVFDCFRQLEGCRICCGKRISLKYKLGSIDINDHSARLARSTVRWALTHGKRRILSKGDPSSGTSTPAFLAYHCGGWHVSRRSASSAAAS